VDWSQVLFGTVLVLILFGVAGFYARQQVAVLRRVPPTDSEESQFQRSTARRRLVTSFLMALLGMLLAWALLFLEEPAQYLADLQVARERAGQDTKLVGADRDFARIYGFFWIGFSVVLLGLVLLAGVDFGAIRRYGRRQLQKLREDRRAMIEHETTRLRERRHGSDDVLRN
jgi:hypothetical protein